ncbi:unnamed protein product [Timema podura]|uniref:URB1 N-terminal domain-containing protein n=1 Tax=Timema podura TaxID=61482 RepID=A0ABN7NWI9_TIMPD|nr:unnamed protein product [Timema podura]
MTTKKRKSLANNDVAENDTPAEKRVKHFSAKWFRDNLYNGNEIKARTLDRCIGNHVTQCRSVQIVGNDTCTVFSSPARGLGHHGYEGYQLCAVSHCWLRVIDHISKGPRFDRRHLQIVSEALCLKRALKNFLEACKNKEDVVGEYFAAGGDAMEIIKLLDRKTDKINLLFTVPLLSVINQIIVSEMRSGEELHRSTEAACRQLLYSHLDTVHFMLGAEASSHSRRTILTLLAAMVTANPQLAKEVLAHVNFPPSELKQLTTHRKPQDKNNTRTCFIRFLMAFLIGGDVHVIKLLTDKKVLEYVSIGELLRQVLDKNYISPISMVLAVNYHKHL